MTSYRVFEDIDHDAETGVEISTGRFLLCCDEVEQEVFALTNEDSDESMRSLGLVPLEEALPGAEIEGYAEIGTRLYATKD